MVVFFSGKISISILGIFELFVNMHYTTPQNRDKYVALSVDLVITLNRSEFIVLQNKLLDPLNKSYDVNTPKILC